MRKTSIISYDNMDVQKIVKNELEKAKRDWVEEITQGVSKIVTEKFDKIMTVLDKFVGEVDSYRKEQEMTAQTLSEHSDILENFDKRFKKLEHPAL